MSTRRDSSPRLYSLVRPLSLPVDALQALVPTRELRYSKYPLLPQPLISWALCAARAHRKMRRRNNVERYWTGAKHPFLFVQCFERRKGMFWCPVNSLASI